MSWYSQSKTKAEYAESDIGPLRSFPTPIEISQPDDIARQRAGFIDHDLWITPYNPYERYAAGEYAVLSKPGMGLPEWTANNRNVENTDIVVWPTIGMHHLVRSEDWPVMPVLWHEIKLQPFDFNDRSPALNLSKKP